MSEKEEDKFNLAANYIQSNHHKFNKDQLLKFYSFYKQATIGKLDPEQNPKPSFFKLNDRAKWEAWNSLKEMTQEEAMKEYVKLLTDIMPEWIDISEQNSDKSKHSFGVSVSRMKNEDELIDDADKTIEDFIKEGNVEKFKELLSSIEDLNEIDEDSGLALIHWISDRGMDQILETFLSQKGIDVDLQDNEGSTALHYASSCGHTNCIKLLLNYGAKKDILDSEENSCIDVAYDDEIKKMLC
ncbi:hypothetical protein PVAND_013849 [Polypedilum vanderplanki]|uniref:Acyl-CoA-binding domain-containing protein 6 n=1 Tax=Polypedilum vanderplanki TaxID=319348 RepID=A0A9J6CST0_POLVA|nr:hypothetical protein PVAND_013849 [Polypedilum vanderplanki]